MKYTHLFVAAAVFQLCGCGSEVEGEESDDALGVATNELTSTTDFRLAIQVADSGTALPGDWAYTSTYEGGGGLSLWACDGDCYDPDSARLDLDSFVADDVKNRDFKVCIQASDGGGGHSQQGISRCTDWASAFAHSGGTSTGMATDSDGYDPDSYRVQIQTRAWPASSQDLARDVRFWIRGWDKGTGSTYTAGPWSTPTGWASQGGGASGWASNAAYYDPDGFEIWMEVLETNVYSFCSPSHRCEHGFGDCDSNSDCVAGTTCRLDVGKTYGYIDGGIDVCVNG